MWRLFRHRGEELLYRLNYLDDIIDTIRFKPTAFAKLKDLLGCRREREAKQLAKKILCDFMELVALDMIENKALFIFPRQSFGAMRIADTTDPDNKNYYYHMKTSGRWFRPILALSTWVMSRHGREYRVRLSGRHRKAIALQVLGGKTYDRWHSGT